MPQGLVMGEWPGARHGWLAVMDLPVTPQEGEWPFMSQVRNSCGRASTGIGGSSDSLPSTVHPFWEAGG